MEELIIKEYLSGLSITKLLEKYPDFNRRQINKNFFTSAWHCQWRGRIQVLKILDTLYKNNPRFLKRKHDLYLSLKNSLN